MASVSTSEYSLTKKTEAYGSFEVASSLIFGFCVSVLFGNVTHDAFINYLVLEIAFVIVMSITLVLSAYSLIVVSITHYFVNRYMADSKHEIASKYINHYRSERKFARWSFYVSIVSLIISLAIYLYPQLHITSAIISVCVLIIGSTLILSTMYRMLNPHKFIAKTDKKNSITAMMASAETTKTDQLVQLSASTHHSTAPATNYNASIPASAMSQIHMQHETINHGNLSHTSHPAGTVQPDQNLYNLPSAPQPHQFHASPASNDYMASNSGSNSGPPHHVQHSTLPMVSETRSNDEDLSKLKSGSIDDLKDYHKNNKEEEQTISPPKYIVTLLLTLLLINTMLPSCWQLLGKKVSPSYV